MKENNLTEFWSQLTFTFKKRILELKGHVCYQILKDWDIDNQSCIQTIDLTFPAFGIPGKLVEYGRKSIYPGAPDKDPPLLRQPKSGLMLITDISSLDIESCSLANTDHKNEEAEVATINK